MGNKEREPEIVSIPVEITGAEQEDIWGAPQLYSNYVEVHTSSTDFRLSFYVKGPRQKEDGTFVEHRQAIAAIRLPIEMLESIRALVNSQLRQRGETKVEGGEGDES